MSKTYLIFSAFYPPHLGGVEIFTQNLARQICVEGDSAIVVTNNHADLSTKEVDEYGVQVLRVPCISLLDGRFCLNSSIQCMSLIKSELNSKNIDGVLVNTRFYPLSIIGLAFSRFKKIVPVVLDHGSDYLAIGNTTVDFFIKIYEHVITNVGKLFKPRYYGISNRSRVWLQNFGILADGVISNSINSDEFMKLSSGRKFRAEFGLSANCLLVAVVARLIPDKGISQIIAASQNKEITKRNIVFLIAGDGPLRSEVENASSSNLKYVGRLSSNDIASMFLDADLFCLPSRSEGFCSTLLEASACGCPALITNVGVVPDVILNDDYGTVLDNGDSDEIVRSLVSLYDHRTVLKLQGRNVQNRVRSAFSLSKTAQQARKAMNNSL